MKACQYCGEQIASQVSDGNHELTCARNPKVWRAAIRRTWADYMKAHGVKPELAELRKVIEGT